jgi:hypothetical protein
MGTICHTFIGVTIFCDQATHWTWGGMSSYWCMSVTLLAGRVTERHVRQVK